ncbi:hypothetical protein JQW92_18130 [Sulfitobacter pseudonitzschiae]|uniref:helix-turn-helix domain-containing protein n=1 Tax=Pseudosulfitobacter pseudonitzschiae TaxID=1402135 RepID=UPI001AF875C8|nr:helix-turn-helix domain-containing protein [Pseudosulfitobacter pseudonitzschiae]MBM1834177.1 hypothetical protein [Pseudosulfitobacter pseudonitzschiae]MBM1839042.1 hypothetical protein [Pseudosulfitobacter pseudonitzschiae]MBM1843890.1 hypothetical protein [Pseudosulfitobacter pseudonitzschiae]MBM1858440.1 hypothetical protein [Pseudosulfitobacter pseudonitzschiae]MBM1863298.1 hypothetical protein [Pseudosulfitobacter pseudonitzschiae]
MIPEITATQMAHDFALMAARFDPTGHESAKDIINHIAAKHGITVDAMKSPRRFRQLVLARDEAMTIIHDSLGKSLTQTAGYFGRDHTTALAAIRRHKGAAQ